MSTVQTYKDKAKNIIGKIKSSAAYERLAKRRADLRATLGEKKAAVIEKLQSKAEDLKLKEKGQATINRCLRRKSCEQQ